MDRPVESKELKLLCPAKINLYLDVKRKRSDGYHEIDSVMQKISLCDRVTLRVAPGRGIDFKTNERILPTGPKNLAYRAAESYLAEAGKSESLHVEIELYKKIPIAAGLAGGSADAAGVLSALHTLVGGLSRERLFSLALSLGADVPFCLGPAAALCRGLGENFTPCRPLPDCRVLVARHGRETVNTKEAYRKFDEAFPAGQACAASPAGSEGMLDALRRRDLAGVSRAAYNAFEPVILPQRAMASDAKVAMYGAGAFLSMMSGSGPSVFGLFAKEAALDPLKSALRERGYIVFEARPWR